MRRGGGGEIKRDVVMRCGENSKERKGSNRRRGLRRGEELKMNADCRDGEWGEFEKRKGSIRKVGMRRGGAGGDL
jgi:hypothetical protein